MITRTIQIKAFDDVKNLNQVATNQPFDIDAGRGRFIIDAKSLLGIYSLDLSKPMEIILHSDDEAEVKGFLDAIAYLCI